MKRVKVSNCDLASRKYRLGKINAEMETIGAVSVAFCDYIEYCDCIEWDVETLTGRATVLTDYKGEVISARYYND